MRDTRCAISLATASKRFPEALVRLEESLRQTGFTGEFLAWPPGRFPEGCPPHLETPFAFKPFALREARARGMNAVLWLDSTCVAIRSVDSLFEAMRRDGYVLFRNSRRLVGEWASDTALEVFGLDREEAMTIPEVNASAIGLDFSRPIAVEFLDLWYAAARNGVAFRGVREVLTDSNEYDDVKWNRSGRVSRDPRVLGHRHDQTAAGIIAHRLGMRSRLTGLETQFSAAPLLKPKTVLLIDRDANMMDDRKLRSIAEISRDRYRHMGPQVGRYARLLWDETFGSLSRGRTRRHWTT